MQILTQNVVCFQRFLEKMDMVETDLCLFVIDCAKFDQWNERLRFLLHKYSNLGGIKPILVCFTYENRKQFEGMNNLMKELLFTENLYFIIEDYKIVKKYHITKVKQWIINKLEEIHFNPRHILFNPFTHVITAKFDEILNDIFEKLDENDNQILEFNELELLYV